MAEGNTSPKWWNEPLSVALAAGVIIAACTTLFQWMSTERTRQLTRDEQLFDARRSILAEFADGMIRWLEVAEEVHSRVIWLEDNKNSPDKASLRFDDLRNYDDTRNTYEQMTASLRALRQPDSLCAQVRAYYTTEPVFQAVDALDKTLDDYVEAKTQTERKELFKQANKQYQDAIRAMEAELGRRKVRPASRPASQPGATHARN